MLAILLQTHSFNVLQIVSDIASFVKSSEMTSVPIKHRRLAACYAVLVVQKMTLSKICLWSTVCK